MSNCNDIVTIKKTHSDLKSIQILGFAGDDEFVLGDESARLDRLVHADKIIIDGGTGHRDVLWIHNEAAETKISYVTENIDYSITGELRGENIAAITVDFGQGPCLSGKTVDLSEGRIFTVGYEEAIQFGSQYSEVLLKMTDCDDEVVIAQTYPNASSIKVFGYSGDDKIVLGEGRTPIDKLFFANITVDGGYGKDALQIRDESSLVNKSVAVYSTALNGIIGNETISFTGIESIDLLLGDGNMQVDVLSTAQRTGLKVKTQGNPPTPPLLMKTEPYD